jgi:hypothetical protein
MGEIDAKGKPDVRSGFDTTPYAARGMMEIASGQKGLWIATRPAAPFLLSASR